MKPSNSGKEAKQKLKQNAPTPDGDDMQAMSAFCMTQLEGKSQQ